MATLISVDKIAQAFKISERAVQRLVIYDGMPRVSRGQYDLAQCMMWYIRHLHKKACGCAGPCNGIEPHQRNATNLKAERKKALRGIADLADELEGLDAE